MIPTTPDHLEQLAYANPGAVIEMHHHRAYLTLGGVTYATTLPPRSPVDVLDGHPRVTVAANGSWLECEPADEQ